MTWASPAGLTLGPRGGGKGWLAGWAPPPLSVDAGGVWEATTSLSHLGLMLRAGDTNTWKPTYCFLPSSLSCSCPGFWAWGGGEGADSCSVTAGVGGPSLLSGASAGSKFIESGNCGSWGSGGLAGGASAPLAHSRPHGGMSREARVFRGALWHGEVTACSMNGGCMAVGSAGGQSIPHMDQR